MNLSVNDTFSSKENLLKELKAFAEQNNIKYDILETNRTISLLCKGRVEFNCDVSISSSYRKKDDCFVIKKLRLSHKCPITNNDFVSTNDYIKAEIYKAIGDATVRIGDIVSILHNKGIKVSYVSVWRALRENNINRNEISSSTADEKENLRNLDETNAQNLNNNENSVDGNMEDENRKKFKTQDLEIDMYAPKNHVSYNSSFIDSCDLEQWDDDSFFNFHKYNDVLEEYLKEFMELNSEKVELHYYGKMFFYRIPSMIDVLLPVVEVKYYKRTDGYVIYGCLYDPLYEPVIYACCITEGVNDLTSLKYFFKSLKNTFFIIEYDTMLVNILESLGESYFIKTRDICKFIYNIDNNKENIEKVWNACNYGKEKIEELSSINPKRYLKQLCGQNILNLNNLPECDVDFIMYSVYSLQFFDCINAIHKLANDNLKFRKRFMISDTKSMFGSNVICRVERNKSILPKEELKVDMKSCKCECGQFQELLIPCVHACKIAKDTDTDPYLYVSSVYSRDQLNKLDEVIPVLNINVKIQPDKIAQKKGPGRPKKNFKQEQVEIILE